MQEAIPIALGIITASPHKSVDIKFNIPALKKDMETKTSILMAKTFKK